MASRDETLRVSSRPAIGEASRSGQKMSTRHGLGDAIVVGVLLGGAVAVGLILFVVILLP